MKVKANSVKQEFEKQDELKRSAMRAVASLLTIPDAGNVHFQIFFIFMPVLEYMNDVITDKSTCNLVHNFV